MNINIPNDVEYILNLFDTNGYSAYIVGGCVRDSLLNRIPHDWDICTSAKPTEMQEIAKRNNIKYLNTGLKHGTITLILNDNSYEITTFRIDSDYSDGRHPDLVKFSSDIVDDLSRRDFTINAMAFNHKDGLIDPFNGIDDIKSWILRCVGNPYKRFNEDRLRMLRAIRFASTYGFEIDTNTAQAIHELREGLSEISKERIRTELVKALRGDAAFQIFMSFSDVISTIIPDLIACINYNQHNKHHDKTIYEHIISSIDNYHGEDDIVNVALLLHDIGKPATYSFSNGYGHFYNHAKVGAELSRSIVEDLRFSRKQCQDIVELVLYHDMDFKVSKNSVKRALSKFGTEQLNRLIAVRKADILAQSSYKREEKLAEVEEFEKAYNKVLESQYCITLRQLNISGRDIIKLGVKEGPLVGKLLNHLLKLVIDDKIENEYATLREQAIKIIKKLRGDN